VLVPCSGVGGRGAAVQEHPQKFWIVKNPGKNRRNLGKICENLANSLKIWAKSLKTRAKMVPNVVRFMAPNVCVRPFCRGQSQIKVFLRENLRTKSNPNFFRASLGKFGQKSFAFSKNCLLLHLWCHVKTLFGDTWSTRLASKFASQLLAGVALRPGAT